MIPTMITFLKILLLISSLVLIISILMQQGNSAGLSGSIGGGAEQLFGKKKGRGLEKLINRVTFVFAIIFIASSLMIVTWEPIVKDRIQGKADTTATDSAVSDSTDAAASAEAEAPVAEEEAPAAE
jgi:preprotein translocase subunit SecG